ncbi:MAG: hypothetical protein M3Q22_14705 [Actinomycetota bacterium]|nr:hypothetical protein [Actinomycetota bacterium]
MAVLTGAAGGGGDGRARAVGPATHVVARIPQAAAVRAGCLPLILPAPHAAAHHPEVVAAADCTGRVNFSVLAWLGQRNDPDTQQSETDLSRTNSAIEVAWAGDGRAFQVLPQRPQYRLDKAGGYSFTGTFELPQPLPGEVVVRARALERWANGAMPGRAVVSLPVDLGDCPPSPSAPPDTVAGQSSEAGPSVLSTDSGTPLPWALGGAALLGGLGLFVTRPRSPQGR